MLLSFKVVSAPPWRLTEYCSLFGKNRFLEYCPPPVQGTKFDAENTEIFPIREECRFREQGFPKIQKNTFILYQRSKITYLHHCNCIFQSFCGLESLEISKIARFQVERIFSKKFNSDIAKIVAEEICEQHPKFKAYQQNIKFSP